MESIMWKKFCLVCGKGIPSWQKFCSQSHAATYNNQKRKKITKTCACCGEIFQGFERAKNKFCCLECSTKYRFEEIDKEYQAGKLKSQTAIKHHFIAHNEYKCAICGLSSWMNKKIVLVLDHIDGNPENNLPSNLRLVCPNCDSQLDTYKSKNKGNGRYYRRVRYAMGKSYRKKPTVKI